MSAIRLAAVLTDAGERLVAVEFNGELTWGLTLTDARSMALGLLDAIDKAEEL